MKRIYTFFIIFLFAGNLFAQNVLNNNLNLKSQISKIIIEKTGEKDPVKQYAIEQLLEINGNIVPETFKVTLQKMDSNIVYSMSDLEENSLKQPVKSRFNYLSDGRIYIHNIDFWDTVNNNWTETLKITMDYESTSAINKAVVSYYYNELMWVDIVKAKFHYQADNLVSQIDISVLNPELMVFYDLAKIYFTYNENEKPIKVFVKTIDEDNETWIDAGYLDISYNNNNYISETILSISDSLPEKTFVPVTKSTLEYEVDYLKTVYQFSFDTVNNSWEKDGKKIYVYDANNNISENQIFAYENNVWIETSKVTFEYNNDFAYDQLVLPYKLGTFNHLAGQGNLFNHMLIKTETFFNQVTDKEWVKVGESDYYYSNGEFSSINETENNVSANVYPNPAKDFAYFKFNSSDTYTLQIFDLTGKKVLSTQIKTGDKVSIKNLSSGLFFFKLTKENINITGKLIKQ